uniref:Uncharacterized protein n=1 Tax=Anguilla anguilla TaxID=7936 RepID=A0A0E9X227_ANGAN
MEKMEKRKVKRVMKTNNLPLVLSLSYLCIYLSFLRRKLPKASHTLALNIFFSPLQFFNLCTFFFI